MAEEALECPVCLTVPEGEHPPDRIVREVKDCLTCHPIGDKATREMLASLGSFDTTLEAWDRRVQSGQMGAAMNAFWRRLGDQKVMFADWSDRIAAGEFPSEPPPRPSGRERNVVITMWDWANPTSYVHDEAAADKRDPSGSPDRPIFGAVQSDDLLVWVDPATNAVRVYPLPQGSANATSLGGVLALSLELRLARVGFGAISPRNYHCSAAH